MTIHQRIKSLLLFVFIGLPLIAFISYAVLGATTDFANAGQFAAIAAAVATGGALAMYCVGSTLEGMQWHSREARGFLIQLVASAGIAEVVGWLLIDRGGVIIGLQVFIALCIFFTLRKLRHLPAEALRPKPEASALNSEIRCPSCGYNMRGLYRTECPECGAKYTLDEFLIANSHRKPDTFGLDKDKQEN